MKVTLFPFLSVLLCMMGAMIMLLVVVAKNVREQAIAPTASAINNTQTLSAEEADTQRQNIALRTEDADWLAENYQRAQIKAEEELTDIHNKLALAEKETQKLREEIQRLQQLARQLIEQPSAKPEEVEQLKKLLAQQQQQKEQAEKELAELQQEAEKQKQSYAIVPYKGENGTFRKPIYIECCNDKIIIQPEGIELRPSDFFAADRPDNVFDTVLRTIRQYYGETNQVARGSEPYPLWIIRPSGVAMYEEARQATGNWVKEFGYEIVNEDWNVKYPPASEELRHRITQQLKVSRSRLNGYMIAHRIAMQSSGGGGSGQQYRVDSRGNVMPTGERLSSEAELQAKIADQRQTLRNQGTNLVPPNNIQQQQMQQPSQQTSQQPQQQKIEQQDGQQFSPAKEESKRQPNWALKESMQYASGISRTVRIRCEADRYILSAQAGLSVDRVIPIVDSSGDAVDRLVQAIWEYQDSWGSAGENVSWRPRLQVHVVPGGERRLAELRKHLQGSGLIVE